MAITTTLFWDVGGVLLTNGWDTKARRRAAEKFGLAWDDFEERHELVGTEFEKGQMTLEEYLRCTVFHCQQEFSSEAFVQFMYQMSAPHRDALDFAGRLADASRYLMATLNNESHELNRYRIETFGLRRIFTAFFSSCFLGTKKPEPGIYRAALQITQRAPDECVFIDDRALNVEAARRLGITAIHFENVAQLQRELAALGVETGPTDPHA